MVGNTEGEFAKNVLKKKTAETIPAKGPVIPDNVIIIPASPYYSSAYNELALKFHNRYRNMHQVGDVVFDAALAKGAQTFAAQLTKAGKLSYSTPAKPGAPDNSGENVVMEEMASVLSTTSAAFDKWYQEGVNYDFGRGGYQKGTGHFTQMVWKATTRFGCGIDGKFAVCRYAEAGNKVGFFKFNVFPKGVNVNTKKKAGESCEKVGDERPACAEGLCCGQSSKVTDPTQMMEHCMMASLKTYSRAKEPWQFQCFEAGMKLVASAAAVLASVYAMIV